MKIKEGFVIREVAGEYVVMNVGGDTSFNGMITLNETGAFIWKAIEEGKSEDGIADKIVLEYDIDKATALNDVKRFIIKMSEAGVLEQEN